MASSSLTPYKNSTEQETFSLVSTSGSGAKYMVSGRSLANPFVIECQRKLTPATASGNDHVVLRLARTESNATTSKLATCQVLVDVSIPKDTSVLTATVQKELVALAASLLNEATAMEATNANITALVEGRDL